MFCCATHDLRDITTYIKFQAFSRPSLSNEIHYLPQANYVNRPTISPTRFVIRCVIAFVVQYFCTSSITRLIAEATSADPAYL